MKIAIALPCSGRYPIGGFRIVYEHANRLAASGHEVTIYHATNIDFRKIAYKKKLFYVLLFLRDKLSGKYKPSSWFQLDARINSVCSMSIKIPQSRAFDVAIATAWQTAAPVARSHAKRKFYLVQHFEDWNADADSVVASWKLPLSKIAISRWLKQLIETHGESCQLVPNAIDTNFFHPTSPIEDRVSRSVLIQLHSKKWKGSADALEAIRILRRRGEMINLFLFGIPNDKDFTIEGSYTYIRNPAQDVLRDLYGKVAVFVAASWTEGWGLTPHEASACGAAIAGTDIDGHREFLEQDVSALLSPPKDARALANNIHRLLNDEDFRVRIAQTGFEAAHRFTWEKAAALFESALYDETEAFGLSV